MKLFPVHPILWSSLLVLWASHSEMEANSSDVCEEDQSALGDTYTKGSAYYVEKTAVFGNFLCILYPTNMLNCSWSFPTLQKGSQLFVSISVCTDEIPVQSLNYSFEERVGSRSLILEEPANVDYVILQFNVTLHDRWTVYTSAYDIDMLEVLSPPKNISAFVKDGGLRVTWDMAESQEAKNPKCFEYQLDLGDQERPKNLTSQLSYTELNADPSRTYRARVRTRQVDGCQQNSQWSDWSQTITVEQSVYELNILVIISISLGIPMILLAVLLLVCHQRVSKVLFPPIPHPPPKYKCFLEKNDTFNLFHPALPAEPEAEITEVEDMEQKPGKTF